MTGASGTPRWLGTALAVACVVGFLLPVVLYWYAIGRAPSISPEDARRNLAAPGSRAVLVDVRPPAAFAREHLVGAANWPFAEIRALDSVDALPRRLRGRPLYLLCDNGIQSALAALRLRSLGLGDVYSVKDGMCGWIASAAGETRSSPRLVRASGETADLPSRVASPFRQWVAIVTGYVIKPLYMAISLLLIVWLWRRRSPDLVALRWGMIAFLAGEGACAVNFVLFRHQSHLAEYLHSSGMVLCFGLATYAIFEGIDSRLIHFSDRDRRCAAIGLCGPCIKHSDVPCGLKRVFLLLIPCMMALGFMPLVGEPQMVSYNSTILGYPYNYSHPFIYQVFEGRFCPVYGILLLGASLLVLLVRKDDAVHVAKPLFAAGMGPLGFALLRFMIFRPYIDDLVWFQLWEEITELLFIGGALCVLWIFRSRLFAAEGVRGAREGADQEPA